MMRIQREERTPLQKERFSFHHQDHDNLCTRQWWTGSLSTDRTLHVVEPRYRTNDHVAWVRTLRVRESYPIENDR